MKKIIRKTQLTPSIHNMSIAMSRVHYQSRHRISHKNAKHSKHGKLDMSVFHHESTPRDPSLPNHVRSIRPPSTTDMLQVLSNSPRPKNCGMYCHVLLCLVSICLSLPELLELQWWENISSTATVLSWGPFACVLSSLLLTVVALCCGSRAMMLLATFISFISLPLIVGQLAVCSTPAVLTMCCCFPSQCLLSLSHVSDTLSDHIQMNETCKEFLPVRRNNYDCEWCRTRRSAGSGAKKTGHNHSSFFFFLCGSGSRCYHTYLFHFVLVVLCVYVGLHFVLGHGTVVLDSIPVVAVHSREEATQ